MIAIDAGNTRFKAALIKNNIIMDFVHTDNFSGLSPFLEKYNDEIIWFSSVRNIELPYKKISHSIKFSLTYDYNKFENLGIDRICSSEAAFKLSNRNNKLIVVDFGTATTINFIEQNIFLGGMILPGINTMFSSLHNNTDLLPQIEMNDYKEFIGKSTKECIASGVVNSHIALIENAIRRFTKNDSPELFITGGNSIYFKDKFPNAKFEPHLVLLGISFIQELNSN